MIFNKLSTFRDFLWWLKRSKSNNPEQNLKIYLVKFSSFPDFFIGVAVMKSLSNSFKVKF